MKFQTSVSFAVFGVGVAFALLVLTPRTPAADLFAYWALEETDPGDEAEDSGPNGLDGFLLPEVNPDVDGAPGFGAGAEFDGTIDGSIDLGPDNLLGTLTNDFSIVAWIFPTDLTGKNRIIGSLQSNGWGFGPRNNNQLEVTTFGVKDYRASVVIPEGEWNLHPELPVHGYRRFPSLHGGRRHQQRRPGEPHRSGKPLESPLRYGGASGASRSHGLWSGSGSTGFAGGSGV